MTIRQNDVRQRSAEAWLVYKIGCLALLLLAPLAISRSIKTPLALGLPGVQCGDEPHYLVLINSLINDGDCDLANNYQDVHRGGLQAGRNFAGQPLDHHVNWYQAGQLVRWHEAYETDPLKWELDRDGHPVPTLIPDSTFRPVSEKEYSQHPAGLAFLLSPILFLFRGTCLIEPLALICSGLATVGGCCAWCWLVKPYTRDPVHLVTAAQMAYLGSPLWHYGQVLFAESFLAFFSVAAFAVALRGEKYGIAGLLLAAGLLIKPPFILIALPLIGDALMRRQWRQAIACCAPVVLAVFLVLYGNLQMHGGWLRNPQEWEPGSLVAGVFELAFSWDQGLLLVSPSLFLSALVIRDWYRDHRRDAAVITAATLLYGGMMACWMHGRGGMYYSARLILPIVPFLFVPMALLFESRLWLAYRPVRIVGTALIGISILFGAISAFECNYVWEKHPLALMGFPGCRR